jgi:deoxyribodipyrimidine photo-lyase
VWAHVGGGPARDVGRFRDELLWQEYARHLYARLGERTSRPLRFEAPQAPPWEEGESWTASMACVALAREELERDGWLVNQTRMWLASQWSVRAGAAWRNGEDLFFRHLLDGSRAANRLGWQWTVGTATGKSYAFTRWQVEKRAPGLCRHCELEDRCPIEHSPRVRSPGALEAVPGALREVAETETGAGPMQVERRAAPEAVWITAESLGDDDPALATNPERPAVFVFDEARLARWQLSAKRLVFLVETLAELATCRPVEVWRGAPALVLARRRVAVTHTPTPGFRAIARRLDLAEIHPWPWLHRPHAGSVESFSQWRKRLQLRRGGKSQA